jgi:hypothetical protein
MPYVPLRRVMNLAVACAPLAESRPTIDLPLLNFGR